MRKLSYALPFEHRPRPVSTEHRPLAGIRANLPKPDLKIIPDVTDSIVLVRVLAI